MKKLTNLVLTILIATSGLFAQKSPAKFGKVTMEEMKMTQCDIDSSASAVVLFDFGITSFVYGTSGSGGFQINFERHTRIKILNKNGFSYANIEIPFYYSGSDKESVGGIKGYVYNLEDGEIVKEKLSRKNIYTEEVNKNKSIQKFSFPNIKEGSVIEFKYSIMSDFVYNMRDWYFQKSIPVLHSEYYAKVPEYFKYNQLVRGYEPVSQTTDSEPGRITFTGRSSNGGYETNSVNYLNTVFHYVAKNVPAIKDEPYVTTMDNYTTRVEYELQLFEIPGYTRQDYTTDWQNINKELLFEEKFGAQLNHTMFLKDELKRLEAKTLSPIEKGVAIYEYIKRNMKWNENTGLYTSNNTRKAFKEKTGNVAEINLMLTAMLREAGLNAEPVALSTRRNGVIHPSYPSISQFNYVIACLKIDTVKYLLDATEKLCPFGMLPDRCINGQGRVISKTSPGWVNLNNCPKYVKSTFYDISLSNDGSFKGKVTFARTNYAALDFRNRLGSSTDVDEYIKTLEEKNNGLKIKNYTHENVDSIYSSTKEEYEVEISDKVTSAGNLMYFNPMLYEAWTENPFKLKERQFPVDFTYPIEENFVFKIALPEGYQVEELPKPGSYLLPGNKARFIYSANEIGGFINLIVKFTVNKSIFLPTEYPNLKAFFNQVIAKQAEQVVLKKS